MNNLHEEDCFWPSDVSEQEILTAQLVDQAISLDTEIKSKKKKLDSIKARLQSIALQTMENKNLRYVRFAARAGMCETAYKTKLEVDNYGRLVYAIADKALVQDKIKRSMEVKYDVEKRFKDALTAYIRRDYAQHDLETLLDGLGITEPKMKKVVLKKLKGDYSKDKAVLEAAGCTGALEEELDAIREELNWRLVDRYFDVAVDDVDEIRKAVFLEDTISITLTSRDDG